MQYSASIGYSMYVCMYVYAYYANYNKTQDLIPALVRKCAWEKVDIESYNADYGYVVMYLAAVLLI